MPDKIPFDELKAGVTLSAIIGESLPLKRAGREFEALCPFHSEKTPSFKVNDKDGFYHCFGCGAHGDVFDWLRNRQGMSSLEAAEHLGYRNGHAKTNGHIKEEIWEPAIRPPDDAPDPDFSGFDHVYRYADADGRVLRYVARKNATPTTKKKFTPFTWGVLNGRTGWQMKHAAVPRQLYGLELIADQPDATIVVCEGEKSADAARKLLGLPIVTWSGGGQVVPHNDWRPLTGRDVIIWPDADKPGADAAAALLEILKPIARSVEVLSVAGLPPAFDAADLEQDTPESWFWDRLPSRGKAPGPFEPTSLSTRDLAHIPPRRWLYGHELIRGFVTILASPGGVGKTAYTVPVGLSVALGRPLLDSRARVHVNGAVWFYNLEDPLVELDRRIAAALLAHNLTQGQLNDVVYVDSGRDRPLCLAKRNKFGDLEVWPETDALVAALRRRGIVLLVIDPFIHSHEGKENDNGEMAKMIAEWARVADQADCAVWLVHHFRKGGNGADPDAIRGAVAIVGAVRSAWTVSTMSAEEAKALGIGEDDRGYYFRHDNAKQNMAPPSSKAMWHELVNIHLKNGTDDYPDGDFVQAVKAWAPPSPWQGITWADIEAILEKIEEGPEPGEYYAMAKQAKDRWVGNLIIERCGKSVADATQIVKVWEKEKMIESGVYASPKLKGSQTGCVRADLSRLTQIRNATKGAPSFE